MLMRGYASLGKLVRDLCKCCTALGGLQFLGASLKALSGCFGLTGFRALMP